MRPLQEDGSGSIDQLTGTKKLVAPPPIAPRRSHIGVMRAIDNYTAQKDGELSLQDGEIVYIMAEAVDGYFTCRVGDRQGVVPASFLGENTSKVDNPAHDAAKRGNVTFLQELISAGVSVNTKDAADNIPLHWAARAGHQECVELLLSAGSVLHTQNKLGDTPFHSVASCNAPSAVNITRIMLEDSSSSDVVGLLNNAKETAAQIAKDIDVAALLVQATQKNHRSQRIPEAEGDEELSD